MSAAHYRAIRSKAAEAAGKSIATHQHELASLQLQKAKSRGRELGVKIDQQDPSEPVEFDDIVKFFQENPDKKEDLAKLFGRFLHQQFPPEVFGIAG